MAKTTRDLPKTVAEYYREDPQYLWSEEFGVDVRIGRMLYAVELDTNCLTAILKEKPTVRIGFDKIPPYKSTDIALGYIIHNLDKVGLDDDVQNTLRQNAITNYTYLKEEVPKMHVTRLINGPVEHVKSEPKTSTARLSKAVHPNPTRKVTCYHAEEQMAMRYLSDKRFTPMQRKNIVLDALERIKSGITVTAGQQLDDVVAVTTRIAKFPIPISTNDFRKALRLIAMEVERHEQ